MLNWEGIGPQLHVESPNRTRDDFQSRTQSPQLSPQVKFVVFNRKAAL